MVDKETIIGSLLAAVDDLNRQLPKESQIERSTGTVLSGEGGQLDSLGIINFIIAVEQKVEDEFHTVIMLTDDMLLSAADGPLRTIDTLADFLVERLNG
ncbi:hypothetical protein ES703_50229 [subsurface metagenome]